MSYRSFIDVLFILLLSAIVMLAQSFQLGGVDMSPAEVGADGVSPLRADEVRLIVIEEDELLVEDSTFADIEALHQNMPADAPLVLVAGRGEISHQRVMSLWSELQERGRDVRLGVAPKRSDPSDDESVNGESTDSGGGV